jgi:hypothetical protein
VERLQSGLPPGMEGVDSQPKRLTIRLIEEIFDPQLEGHYHP